MANLTVLEEIIREIAVELYQKWYNALPEQDKTEDSSKALANNANETTIFIIQNFMNKFNAAAEELKS